MANIKFSALADGTPLDFTDRFVGIPVSGSAQIFDVNPMFIAKQTDQSTVNNIVLIDDDELVFAGEANKTYVIWMMGIIVTPSVADMDFAWSVPAGATCVSNANSGIIWRGTSNQLIETDRTVESLLGGSGTNKLQFGFIFIVQMGGTAGDVQYQFAQNVTNATNTTMKAGSAMIVFEAN